eukprot:12745779-Alexandrium_andersonii.AAC.1
MAFSSRAPIGGFADLGAPSKTAVSRGAAAAERNCFCSARASLMPGPLTLPLACSSIPHG